jgi:hypothetical protein
MVCLLSVFLSHAVLGGGVDGLSAEDVFWMF